MSEKSDKLMNIFLIESSEIFENLEVQILDLEENIEDKDLINDIFRGVHTLKGNSNSFGFTNLGGIVHYFEDLLDMYREPNNNISEEIMQLILDAYDLMKEVFDLEKEKSDYLPDNYDEILNRIKSGISGEEEKQEEKQEIVIQEEFQGEINKKELDNLNEEDRKELITEINNGKNIFNVVFEFDDKNFYFTTLLKDFSEVKKVFFYMDNELNEYKEGNNVKKTSLYISTEENVEEVEDTFDLKDEDEIVYITHITKKDLVKKEKKVKVAVEGTKKSTSIRIDSEKIDELFDSIGELVITQSFISENEKIKALNDPEINKYLNLLKKTTKMIQTKVMNIRMIPIKDTFYKMKRVVRDVSQKTNKDVDLHLSGEDTEIDKTMIDSLSEPLIHLIRNSIDHGIETSEERLNNGKQEKGNVWLKALHRGNNFVIEIIDDGAGINSEYILQKAISKDIAKEDEEYTEEEILQFLFEPGFSTAETITDVSGRGVGLDSVKQTILDMKGKIQIETQKGRGSKFKIILPLTLAIIDGLVVKAENKKFIIPTLSVIESFQAKTGQVKTMNQEGKCIDYRGEILPIHQLGKILELREEKIEETNGTCICVENDKGKYVLLVDELLGRQQIVIKSLNKVFDKVEEIAGATILGNGEVALILNPDGIKQSVEKGE